MKIFYAALTTAIVVTLLIPFPTTATDSYDSSVPAPGEVLVVNDLVLGANGCEGDFVIHHAPLDDEPVKRVRSVVHSNCSASVSVETLDPPRFRLSEQTNVTLQFRAALATNDLRITGVFSQGSEDPRVCPTGSAAAAFEGAAWVKTHTLPYYTTDASYASGEALPYACSATYSQGWVSFVSGAQAIGRTKLTRGWWDWDPDWENMARTYHSCPKWDYHMPPGEWFCTRYDFGEDLPSTGWIGGGDPQIVGAGRELRI